MSELPAWFAEALERPTLEGTVTVEGCEIAYRSWAGNRGTPILLVHGGAAHSHWWDHIGPHLAHLGPVTALDLSGHGDSGHRESYDRQTWAREVAAVAGLLDGPPVLVGHSLGAFVILTLALRGDADLSGLITVDAPLREYPPELTRRRENERFGARLRQSEEELWRAFRPLPMDGPIVDYVADHIARTSTIELADGWTWKFDPQIFTGGPMSPEELRPIPYPVALFRGDRGSVTDEINDAICRRLGAKVESILIPDSGHHTMLDQPIALITGLRTVLGLWR